MKKGIIKCMAKTSLFCLLLLGVSRTDAYAAVTEGKPGETISGEYAVIVNTNTTEAQSTGTLYFDSTGGSGRSVSSAGSADRVGQDVQPEALARPAVASGAVSYAVGTEKYISTASGNGRVYVCIGVGGHCYIWMEKSLKQEYDAAAKTSVIAKDMAQTYDGRPYEVLNKMAGGNIPCQDNTGKLSILLETLYGASGVYRNDYGITAIHINTPKASDYQPGEMNSRNGLLVHEGQHALFRLMTQYNSNYSYTWLNEGISVAAMDYVWGGTDNSGWLDGIAGNADIRNGSSLFYQNYRNSTATDYGMPYLFVRYLIAQSAGSYAPMRFLPSFYGQSANCAPETYIEKVLGNGRYFAEILTSFYTAVIAQEPDGRYGFAGDPVVNQKMKNYPLYMGESGKAHSLSAAAAIAVRLENGTFTVPEDGGRNIRYMIIGDGRTVSVPAKGDGSSRNPYEISTFRELNLIGNHADACYRLSADISAEEALNLTITDFTGVLDGNGHTIRGLRRPLVGRNSGTIRNLTIEAAFEDEFVSAQGIFAQVNDGLISDCVARGKVRGRFLRSQSSYDETAFGGIAGLNNVAGRIRGCGFTAALELTMPAAKSWTGGIVGIQMGSVEKCYSKGSLLVNQQNGEAYDVYVGGIAGEIRKVGGMGGALSSCFHSGRISVTGGNAAAGQLCGLANSNVVNSPAGLAGHLSGCYARAESIPVVGSPSNILSGDGILLTEEEIGQDSSYKDWDFGGDWKMEEDGPVRIGSGDIRTLEAKNTPVSCYVGEVPAYWGTLLVNSSSGIRITDDMLDGFDSSVPGTVSVRVTYMGMSTDFFVEVKNPGQVTNLTVPSHLASMTFCSGEVFRPGRLYLLATIDGRQSIIYSGFDYDKKSPLTEADTSITFTYGGAAVSCPITVTKKLPVRLTVVSKMQTTQYLEGQNLDLSGVRLQITYNNGEKSPAFGVQQFDAYGIRSAESVKDSCTWIDGNKVLQTEDHGADIILCATEILPGNYDAVAVGVGTLRVSSRLRKGDETLHMTRGTREQYVSSEAVSGGSGKYETVIVKENLPSGITRTGMPNSWTGCFSYSGIPTAQTGSYTSVYRISDTETGDSILAEITIQVHSSDEAEFYRFDLLKAFNPGLQADVAGVIGANTVVLKVPAGTDVTNLLPTIDYGSGSGTESNYWNGKTHDFTNPVIYILTAPDGVTKKQYTVSVEFIPAGGEPTNPGGGTTNPGGGTTKPGGGTTNPGGGTTKPGGGTTNPGGGTTKPGGGTTNPGGGTTNPGSGATKPGGGTANPGSGTANPGQPSGSQGSTAAPAPSAPQIVYPKIGTVVKSGGAYYRITASSASAKTAELKGLVKKKGSSFKIPATVRIEGYTYRVTSVGSRAFMNHKYLKKVSIGKYVASIGTYAFRGCKKLTAVSIPGSVRLIGNGAFYQCTALKKVTIGKSLQVIEKNAFGGCKNLRAMTIQSSKLRSVGRGALKGMYKRAVIRVPKSKIKSYKKLFHKKTGYVSTMKLRK